MSGQQAKFYVTTPIYYVNDIPHIGHAYTTIAADILARHYRLLGRSVLFLTGTDEHGQKVEKAAAEKGRKPKEHADLLVGNFRDLWVRLNISNDAFIRTTDKQHVEVVQQMLQRLLDAGEIVRRSYAGWYCTPDERFWTEKDLIEGKCPDCGRQVEQITEENYFFLMSRYQDRLIAYIQEHPDYILPETRRNEVLGFLANNVLGDLCISRPRERLAWGIPLPFDKDFVTYVWFDALVNYYSATVYLTPPVCGQRPEDFWWPATHHLVGKDILTTHAVYWSAMLMAAGLPLPDNLFAHGWWTVDGRKMSKSLGNVVDPFKIADVYGVDAFRYFLFREVPFGLDGDFSEDALIRRINTDLANDLGNLLSRFLAMNEKYVAGRIGQATITSSLGEVCILANRAVYDESSWSHLRFTAILEKTWEMVAGANNYIAQREPWKLAKADPAALQVVLIDLWQALRFIALALYPFMPATSEKMWRQLGLRSLTDEAGPSAFELSWRPQYDILTKKAEPLFPRIEKVTDNKKALPTPSVSATGEDFLRLDEFARIQLKVGKVLGAERVPKSDKLIKLQVDTGEERQIVAGIGKAYTPEDLVGRKIVVVTNLAPAKLMGVESQGMLLAATDNEGGVSVLVLDRDVKQGALVK